MEKTNLYLLSIVSIVAIVGIIVLIFGRANIGSNSVSTEETMVGQALKTVTILKPDLQPTEFSTSVVLRDSALYYDVVVYNNGKKKIDKETSFNIDITTRFYSIEDSCTTALDDEVSDVLTVLDDDLNPGEATTIRVGVPIPSEYVRSRVDSFWIQYNVNVDSYGSISESDETNNDLAGSTIIYT